MSSGKPNLSQAVPIRNVAIPSSFGIEAVDATAEQTVGADVRERLRKDLGIPNDRSILHPDQPKFPGRGPPGPVPPAAGQPQQPLPPKPEPKPSPPVTAPNGAAPGALGIALEKLVGKFEGTGFNTILRPQNGAKGQGTSDNLLELNFTHETLTFLDRTVLGDVPNRGFGLQPDVNLRGIPYTQQISDLANSATGKPDLPFDKAPGIHFEQGLFMRTPALTPFVNNGKFDTKGPAILGPTITRMASIPHGTTINAQGEDPTAVIQNRPDFNSLPVKLNVPTILPFPIGSKDPIGNALNGVFPQLGFRNDVEKDRIPLNFRDFVRAGTITESQFNNPNNYLDEVNKKQTIVEHVTFNVDTKPKLKLWGGGTDNIAQLAEPEIAQGDITVTHKPAPGTASRANANAIQVTCQYWISTVQDQIRVPVFDKATLPRINSDPKLRDVSSNIVWPVVSPPATAGVRKPTFKIMLDKNAGEFPLKVFYTQIQYSQNVSLDFGTLTWPHISVATLVPADPIPISTIRDADRL